MKNSGKIFFLFSGIVISIGIGVVIYRRVNESRSEIKSILFIGDSNTFANFSYADQIKKQFPGLKLKKLAMNGANTSWMKQQLINELKSNKYDAVSILGGSNDIYGGMKLDATKNNLDEMYNLIHENGGKVVAISPPNKNFYARKTDAKQNMLFELVDWIKNNKNKNYFVDFHGLTNNKNLFSPSDGYLHPQSLAHKSLSGKVQEILNLKNV